MNTERTININNHIDTSYFHARMGNIHAKSLNASNVNANNTINKHDIIYYSQSNNE